MILTKEVSLQVSKLNIKYLSEKGYSPNLGDSVSIDISDLSKNSKINIIAKCDFCEYVKEIQYKLYNKSIKSGGKFSCSAKCADLKRRENLKERYGVDNLSNIPEVLEKRKKTNIENCGFDSRFKSPEFREKNKKILLEKYGVDNYTKTDEYKEKVKLTNLKKWGKEWYLQTEDKSEKSKDTNFKKWGVDFPQKLDVIKSKVSETNMIRYGVKSPMMSEEIKEKSKKTLLENWGVDNPMRSRQIREISKIRNLEKYGFEYPIQSPEIMKKRDWNNIQKWGFPNAYLSEDIRKNMKIGRHPDYIKYLGDEKSLFVCYKGHEFEIRSDNFYKRLKYDIPLCTICNPIGDSKSIKEGELYQYISSIYGGEIIQSYRDGLEIDIYLPDLKLGFEFNGLYWHSDGKKDRNYHLNKTNYFKDRGIRIIHVWEDDWKLKKDVIMSQIRNWVGIGERKIGARKCSVSKISDPKIIKNFLNENHIQGGVNSVIKLGLFYGDELVSVMTFDQSEGRKKMSDGEWNLSRFCNKLNTNVVGGASKLLKFFIDNFKPTRIVSYADLDWSLGKMYLNLGFRELYRTNPDYKYIIDGVRIHKSRFRKSKLSTNLSENMYMKSEGIVRVYDCGKIKFELRIN